MASIEATEVEPALKGGNHGPSGWGFAVYSEVVGDDAPYRALLIRLAASGQARLFLPGAEEGEDFVEGDLVWGNQHIEIYFECQVLSYLAFWSLDRKAVEAVRGALGADSIGP